MKRREVLKKSALVAAGIGALPNLFMLLESCGPERLTNYQPVFLSIEQYETVWQIAELILPRTDSPGANDAAVAPYIDLLYSEFFGDGDLIKYETGLNIFMKNCMARFGKSFMELNETNQIAILQALDKEENDGALFVANGQDGDDTINCTGSSHPVILFGGRGRDTLHTGSGDDVACGDFCLVLCM